MVKKSVYRLLIPWLVFSFIYLALRYPIEVYGLSNSKQVIGARYSDILLSIYGSEYANQLYFLLSLFFVRLCGPLLIGLAKSSSLIPIALCSVIYLFFYEISIETISSFIVINKGLDPVVHALWGLQFYLCGMLIYKLFKYEVNLQPVVITAVLFMTALYLSHLLKWDLSILQQYLYLFFVALGSMYFNFSSRFMDFIGKNTMGIYLLHAPIVMKACSLLVNCFVVHPLISFISILILSTVLSLLMSLALKRFAIGRKMMGES